MNDVDVPVESWPPERLAALSRAAHESTRFASRERQALEDGVRAALGTLVDRRAKMAALKEIDPILAARRPAAAGGAPAVAPAADGGSAAELLRVKASLENRLAGEAEKLQATERALKKEQEDHRHAVETLGQQKSQLKNLMVECDGLRSEIEKLHSDVRLKTVEIEQARSDLAALQGKRQAVSQDSIAQQARINDLERELERARDELERARRERDAAASNAQQTAAAAGAESADTAFQELWAHMRKSLPDVFAETHVPTRKTFERICDTYTYMLRVYFALEGSTKERLKEVRNSNDPADMCNMLLGQLEKTPSLAARLRETLPSERHDGSFRKRMAVVYAATCALPVGLRNVILRSGEAVQARLQVSKWGLSPNPRDADIGKHYRDKVERSAPDEILAELRKSMGKEVFAKYEEEMHKQPA